MAIPILKLGGVLITSLHPAHTDSDLIQLRDDLAEQIGRFRATGLVIDVSTLDIMDSYATRLLRGIAGMARLRGAAAVVVGIQPDVAFAMIQLGLDFEGVATGVDLEEGLDLIAAMTRKAADRGDD
jgi:rsbT antagonist protein RsbS